MSVRKASAHVRGPHLGRRVFLAASGTAAALGLTRPATASGPAGAIDVHAHALPPPYISALEHHGVDRLSGLPLPGWSKSAAIAHMDATGTAAQIVSLPDPGVGLVPALEGRVALAHAVNNYLAAELVYPATGRASGRFGAFAVLPLRGLTQPEIAAARNEAVRALTILKLDGVTLYSNYGDASLADQRLRPLLATLSRLGARVQVHSTVTGAHPSLADPSSVLLEAPFNLTRAAVELSYARAFLLFPRIKWLFGEGAGTLPFLAYRSSLLQYYPAIAQNLGLTVLGLADTAIDLRCLHLDTAWSDAPSSMAPASDVVGSKHILYGSDWPFAPTGTGTPGGLSTSFPDPAVLRRVQRENAMALLPRLRAQA